VAITRRRLVGGAAAVVVAGLGVGYGRYAIGDEFEEHVASTLGVPLETARSLVETAREGLGTGEYEAAAAAFVASTTFPGRTLIPRGTREHAIEVFLNEAMPSSTHNLMYLGLIDGTTTDIRCRGLVRP
jgi:hypothetical protein